MYDDDIQTGITASFANRSFYKVAKFPTRNITAPIVLVYGGSDSLVDIEVMLKELPYHTVVTPIDHFEHLDFLWGQDVEKIIFPHILDALAKFPADPEVELSLPTVGGGADRAVASQEEKVTETLKQEPQMVEPQGREGVVQLTVDVLPPTYSEDEAEVGPSTAAAAAAAAGIAKPPHPELESRDEPEPKLGPEPEPEPEYKDGSEPKLGLEPEPEYRDESEPKLGLEPEPEYRAAPEPATPESAAQLVDGDDDDDDGGPALESAPSLTSEPSSEPSSEPALEQAPKTPDLEPALVEQAPETPPVLELAPEPETHLEPASEETPKSPVLDPASESEPVSESESSSESEPASESELASESEPASKSAPESPPASESGSEPKTLEAPVPELSFEPAFRTVTPPTNTTPAPLPTPPAPSPPIVRSKEEAPVEVPITPPAFPAFPANVPTGPRIRTPTRPASRSPPSGPSLARSVFPCHSSSNSLSHGPGRVGSPLARSNTPSYDGHWSPAGLNYPPPRGPAAQTGVALTYERPTTPMTHKRRGSFGSNRSSNGSATWMGTGGGGISVNSGIPLSMATSPSAVSEQNHPDALLYSSTLPPFSPPTGPAADRTPPTGPRNPGHQQRRFGGSPNRSDNGGGYGPDSPRGGNKNRRRPSRGRGRGGAGFAERVGAGRLSPPYRGSGQIRMTPGGEGSLYSDSIDTTSNHW